MRISPSTTRTMPAGLAVALVASSLAACGGGPGAAPAASVRCDVDAFAPFPTPRQLVVADPRGVVVRSLCVEAGAGVDATSLSSIASSVAQAAGLASGPSCDWRVVVGDRDALGADARAAIDALGDGGERFAAMTRLPWLAETRVAAVDLRAARHALEELVALAPAVEGGGRCAAALSLVDGPAFATRGVIEGFYGVPTRRASGGRTSTSWSARG
jgi:hypothetical protein